MFSSSSHPQTRNRRRSIAALAAATFAALAFIVPQHVAVAAPATSSTSSSAPKPTVVLVHGAWADSSSWSRVIDRLRCDGYPVVAPPNPLRGLLDDTLSLKSFLATVAGPIVLVGHSYGGAVMTDAATGNTNVKALVYVDAFMPDQGETVQQLLGAQPGSALAVDPTTVFNFVPIPGGSDTDLYLKADVYQKSFAGDVNARRSAEFAATQRPLALSSITQKSGPAAWHTIPSWYVIGTADKVLPPAEQLAMAQRAGSHITKVNASHLSPYSQPRAVEKVIVAAAEATR